MPGTTVLIADDGEIWLGGGQVFTGYLNNEKATDEVLRDGWLATGDLGALDEDGYLTITGRKKEILVTSGGKSVSPAALEDRVRSHPLVAQCVAVGNNRPFVAALVTLDTEAVTHWLKMRGKPMHLPTRAGARLRPGDWRSGGRWSPPTPWSRRPSRSAPSASWPRRSPRSAAR